MSLALTDWPDRLFAFLDEGLFTGDPSGGFNLSESSRGEDSTMTAENASIADEPLGRMQE